MLTPFWQTLIRRAIRLNAEKLPAVQAILPHLKYNVALVFTKGNLSNIRDKLVEYKVAAPAKAGTIAPADVIVPKGNTGMEPTKTSFLQALNIPSKINKGQVCCSLEFCSTHHAYRCPIDRNYQRCSNH